MDKEQLEAEIAKERQLMLDSIWPSERMEHAENIARLAKLKDETE